MAVAETPTLLPLDTWARIMGFNPLHFNGVYVPNLSAAVTCGSPILQHAWQGADAISRDDIAEAIASAESRIAQYTRFKLLPTFERDERHQWPRSMVPELYGVNTRNARGQGTAFKTDWGQVVAAGVEGRTLVATPSVAYVDADGDTYAETATFSVSTTLTDPNELRVFYPGESGEPEWEIRPVKLISANGVTASFQCRREQLVNPGKLDGFDGRAVDGTDGASFLGAVDVYRVYHDPSQQVQFLWENQPFACGCGTSGCQTCFLAAQFGCGIVRDYRTGMMSASAASWDSTSQAYTTVSGLSVGRAPDRVRLWYRAGYRSQSQTTPMLTMDPRWAMAVAYMATAELTRPMCSCANVTSKVEYYQEDLAFVKTSPTTSENWRVDAKLLANPFGTTRGAIYAWRVFRNESIGEAVTL